MTFMYNPYGMAFLVPNGREKDYLKWGYSYDNPVAQIPIEQPTETPAQTPVVAVETEASDSPLKINSASLKAMMDRLGISNNQARDVRDGRNYLSIQELITKFPDIPWTTFTLDFEV